MFRGLRPNRLLSRLLSGAVARTLPPRVVDDVLADSYVRICSSGADRARLEALCRDVRPLPERRRQILVLKKAYGLSQQEIARTLGLKLHTVEKELAAAVHQCFELGRRRSPAPAPRRKAGG